jgi:hypothetical protein
MGGTPFTPARSGSPVGGRQDFQLLQIDRLHQVMIDAAPGMRDPELGAIFLLRAGAGSNAPRAR